MITTNFVEFPTTNVADSGGWRASLVVETGIAKASMWLTAPIATLQCNSKILLMFGVEEMPHIPVVFPFSLSPLNTLLTGCVHQGFHPFFPVSSTGNGPSSWIVCFRWKRNWLKSRHCSLIQPTYNAGYAVQNSDTLRQLQLNLLLESFDTQALVFS